MRRLVFVLVVAAVGVGAAAPQAGRPPALVAPRVEVAGIVVGGLTSELARARIRFAYDQPLRFVAGRKSWRVWPGRFAAIPDVDTAVTHALKAPRGARLELPVRFDRARVRSYVDELDRAFSFPARDAAFAGLAGLRPVITDAKRGRAVRTSVMAIRITRSLRTALRRPIRIATRPLEPDVTASEFGPVIVIRRGSNRLDLYDGERPWRSFRVATGQTEYPTPLGTFSIVDMQRHPWWRPPKSDWAKGLKPVPPGPGNPLGTRWMGISAPGVGMHGTPDAASIGYSASHGCIRMLVPDAEWLFDHVHIGTPVAIVSA